ncbi:MAG: SDR family oxidoreductase [Mariprofundales bacterium]|nr:SDR family oxidoreductase [Mariprofundales bacterium]
MFSSTSVLITGGSGLLAVNWAVTIRERCAVVLGMHKRAVNLSGVQSDNISLESVDSVQRALDRWHPTAVIHTAGLTSVERCESDPTLAHHVNVELAENVAKACSLAGVSMVHISTDHLFSGKSTFVEEGEVVEPQNVYGITKAAAEMSVLSIDPNALVIRTNFFGWGTSYRQSFSDWILSNISRGETVTLFTDVFYTPVFIASLVEVVHELLAMRESGVFNVTGDERCSKYQFGVYVADQFGFDRELLLADSMATRQELVQRPLDMSLSNKKVCTLLGRSLGGGAVQVESLHRQQGRVAGKELGEL